MSDYHEPEGELSDKARDLHRALSSFKEEIEAIDWYHQRWELCTDENLRGVIAHNRDEEIEHATMTLEWLRRNMPQFDEALRTYLFTEGPIAEIEEAHEAQKVTGEDAAPSSVAQSAAGDLGIGSRRRLR